MPLRDAVVALVIGICIAVSSDVALAQRVQANQGAIAIGGSVAGSTISIGIPPEQLAALVRQTSDLSEAQKKIITSLERDLALTHRQISGALRILGQENVATEQLGEKLVEMAQRFQALQEKVLPKPDDISRIAALKTEAQDAVAAFDLARADALLEQIEAEQRRHLDETSVSVAEISAQRARVALTGLRYPEAASHFARAEGVLPAGSSYDEARVRYLGGKAQALLVLGTERNDMTAFQQAVDDYGRLVDLQPRDLNPTAWANALITLAAVTIDLTIREYDQRFGLPPIAFKREKNGTLPDPFHYKDKLARIDGAIALFGPALEELSPGRAGLDWSRGMVKWGQALSTHGDVYREVGRNEMALAKQNEAVGKIRFALKAISQQDTPDLWAFAQDCLADALAVIGNETKKKDVLQEAIAAREASLRIRQRANDPVRWALAQTALANSVENLARLSSDPAALDVSVALRREALQELSPERAPVAWAYAQRLLGQDLRSQAQNETGTERLEQALEAFEKSFAVSSDYRTRVLLLQTRLDLENRRSAAASPAERGAAKSSPAAAKRRR